MPFFLILSLVKIILFATALYSVLTSTSFKTADRLIWVLVVVLAPFIGAILYFAIGRADR